MGSDANKMNDGTSYQPTEPSPCTNGCAFFGTAATNGYCSKCYRDMLLNEEHAASAKAAVKKLVDDVTTSVTLPTTNISACCNTSEQVQHVTQVEPVQLNKKAANRCLSCKKKVGVMGFKCRCGDVFCGAHRYPEEHDCEYDFKRSGKEGIAKANPVVKADKVDRI